MYDLLNDPQERVNVASQNPVMFEAMKARLIEVCGGDIAKGICYC